MATKSWTGQVPAPPQRTKIDRLEQNARAERNVDTASPQRAAGKHQRPERSGHRRLLHHQAPSVPLSTCTYTSPCSSAPPYHLSALPCQSDPARLTFRSPIALSSYPPTPTHESSAPRRQLDGGVPPAANGRGGGQTRPWRRGCPRRPCCCAVLVVAGPDGVCPEEPPAGLERSGVVAVVDPASRHAMTSVAGVQQAVSTHPVLASGIRLPSRPVSGHLGSSSRGSGGRPSAVRPSGVQPSAVHPVRPDTSVSSRLRRWGPGRGGRVTVTTGTGGGPVAAGPSTARSMVVEAGTRALQPKSRW
jgi:hypothetical protein